jgi:hypothetical protein
MRYPVLVGLVLASSLGLPLAAPAQPRTKTHIEKVQVGFPSGPQTGEFKAGAWTPVYVYVTAGSEGIGKGEVLLIEATDSDDVRNHYTVPLPLLNPGESDRVLAYTKPGSANSEIDVSIRDTNQNKQIDILKENYPAKSFGESLYVMVGRRLPGLWQALRRAAKQGEAEAAEVDFASKETGPCRLAFLAEDVRLLPTRWFAYDPVDLLILTTGDRDFLLALLNDQQNRKEALAEWVRRGGRIVIAAGRNQDVVAKLDEYLPLPATVAGIQALPQLRGVERFAGLSGRPLWHAPSPTSPGGARRNVEVTKLERKPGKEIEELVVEPDGSLLIAQSSYGMGRVTLVGFDLDEPPFTSWKGQEDFWDRFLLRTAPPVNRQVAPPTQRGLFDTDHSDLVSQLQINLEEFDDVPVISFGWVALFILLYIVVVGPLDYLFLKKVVKRLELTWITFPVIVITISVAAYFTAYWLKGNDQRINKVDLLDVDLHGRQVYGHSWFTLFSPRIQNYTLGLEPAEPGWAAPAEGKKSPSMLLSWMGRPDASWGGTGRAHSQSLFRRAYDYAPDATGLRSVPIQVWSTKSFTASWQTEWDPARPLFRAEFRHPPDRPTALSGTITSGLPRDVVLEDAALFYDRGEGGRWYSLGTLLPGIAQRIDSVLADPSVIDMNTWLSTGPAGKVVNPNTPGRRSGPAVAEATQSVVKRLLFNEDNRGSQWRNTALRRLDQSWRLHHKEEAVLFGRIARREGAAEEVTTHPASPSRLWLGGLPGPGQARQPLPGTLSQETYVRVFIPVKSP